MTPAPLARRLGPRGMGGPKARMRPSWNVRQMGGCWVSKEQPAAVVFVKQLVSAELITHLKKILIFSK